MIGWARVFFPLLSLFLVVHSPFLNAQMHFEQIGNTKLIPDNVVTDIQQDTEGYLWIATAAGVVRYDGYRYKLFENEPNNTKSLGGNFVRNINVFADGTLWLSTEPGGVSIYHPDTENFSRLFDEDTMQQHPGLSSVSQVVREDDNRVWLSTNSGVFLATIDGEVLSHFTKADGLLDNGVRALIRDEQNNIWVGTRAGLARYVASENRFVQVSLEQETQKSLYIRSLYQANDGIIWVGTNASGLFYVDAAKRKLVSALANQPSPQRNNTIYDIFQYNENELWLARFGGIDRVDASSGMWLSRIEHDPSDSYGLANNDIRTILKDESGLLWVGGYGSGVQRLLSNPDWQTTYRFSLQRENALTESNVSSLLALKNGLIWVGTRGSGINVIEPEKGVVKAYQPNAGVTGALRAGWITTMAEMDSGDVWVGANPGHLYRYNPQTSNFKLYTAEQGLPRGNLRVLKPALDGGLWIGTNSGLVYWNSHIDSFTSYSPPNETARIAINAMYQQSSGRLWVATGAVGLFVVEPDEKTMIPIEGTDEKGRSLRSMSIVGMLEDSSGTLWLDTPGGLYSTEFISDYEVALTNHSDLHGFGGRPFGANILQDPKGRLWSPAFIYDVENQEMKPLQRADGVDIGTSWYRSFTETIDGKFLFGGSRGLIKICPDSYTTWDFQPSVVASELRVDGVHVNAGLLTEKGLTLKPTQRTFSVEITALDLSAPEQNLYRYKLVDFDNDWIEVDATRRVASYSNLWPGTYTFMAQGTNRSGQWSDKQLRFQVTVIPAYWQTPWFIMACVIVFASLIYQGSRMRTRWIKERARELEVLVAERTVELKKAQQDIIEQEKMASLGGLVAGVSHEINTPMGIALTAATSLSDDYKSIDKKISENALKRSELRYYLDKAVSSNMIVINSLERACDLMASFKQVAVDQTSEQRREFEVKSFLADVERSLHSLYSPDGHSLNIECPEGLKIDSFPGALFQVFTNLVNNSVIHGFNQRENGTISISVEKQGDSLSIAYADNGVGMTPEVMRKAFEPFFTTKLGVGGSGLGLHLVYNYITQVLGGKIRINSSVETGFACKIDIPIVAPIKDQNSLGEYQQAF